MIFFAFIYACVVLPKGPIPMDKVKEPVSLVGHRASGPISWIELSIETQVTGASRHKLYKDTSHSETRHSVETLGP